MTQKVRARIEAEFLKGEGTDIKIKMDGKGVCLAALIGSAVNILAEKSGTDVFTTMANCLALAEEFKEKADSYKETTHD